MITFVLDVRRAHRYGEGMAQLTERQRDQINRAADILQRAALTDLDKTPPGQSHNLTIALDVFFELTGVDPSLRGTYFGAASDAALFVGSPFEGEYREALCACVGYGLFRHCVGA